MTKARGKQVSLAETPYYHCMSRCVSRAFLCGKDTVTGRDYQHRRDWVVERIELVCSMFCIEVAAYAVMNKQFHVVLYVDQKKAESLSSSEVIERWGVLFKGTPLVKKYCSGESLDEDEHEQLQKTVQDWRHRLMDIGWFMRCINEYLARRANKEDGCKGRFWDGRFDSKALLDEAAIIKCMAYVDLSPIHTNVESLACENRSSMSSIQQRIDAFKTAQARELLPEKCQPKQLMDLHLFDNEHSSLDRFPLSLNDYIVLVDWSGRAIQKEIGGSIPNDIVPILDRLKTTSAHWLSGFSR